MATTNQLLEQMSLAIAYMVQNQADFSDAQALQVKLIYPEWHIGVDYRVDQVVRYNDGAEGSSTELYRCAQAHLSQGEWTPDASASLWSKIILDEETGYEVWTQPTGGHDAYNVGDKVLYPDADGQLYESLINGNTYSPEAYPAGWKTVSSDGESEGLGDE